MEKKVESPERVVCWDLKLVVHVVDAELFFFKKNVVQTADASHSNTLFALLLNGFVHVGSVRNAEGFKRVSVDRVHGNNLLGCSRVTKNGLGVNRRVCLERRFLVEPRVAHLARKRLFASVRSDVALQLVLGVEQLVAVRALMLLSPPR
jgi:hypothetical protein